MSFDSDMEARLQIVTCNIRIVGGCMAGHVPWYVYIIIGITNKCGGVLINKFWVLSAAHCFCEKFPCSRVKDGNIEKWKIDYNISDFSKIQVSGPSDHSTVHYSRPGFCRS